MAVAADSIRHLTRAFIGARVYQGVLFWLALAHNIKAFLTDVGYPNRSLQMWLTLGAIVAAATMGTYYRWRFGRVEPPKPLRSRRLFADFKYGVVGATALALLVMTAVIAIFAAGDAAGTNPMDIAWLLLSAGTGKSLATSRGERLGWVTPLLASAVLLVTLVVPALQPYRAVGHAAMAAALVVTAVQLHLFVVRGFRHAHV
jgi:hypothetical protein